MGLLLYSPSFNSTKDTFQKCANKPTATLFWATFCMVSIVLGVPACVTVLQELCLRRRQGIFNDVFMFNLSIMDLTFTLALLLGVANYMVVGNQVIYVFGAFTHGFPLCGRPLFMACICGDCYFAVIHPIIYMTNRNGTRVRELVSLAVWMTSAGFGFVLSLQDSMFVSTFICIPLMISLPIITFCDVSIFRALRSPDPSGKSNVHPKKKRALQIICTSFTMTFTTYLPPVIMSMLANLPTINKEDFFCTFTFYGLCFCVAGCVIMPVLYLDNTGKLDGLKLWLKRCI